MNMKSTLLAAVAFAGLALCSPGDEKAVAPAASSEDAKARREAYLKMSPEEKEQYAADRRAKVAERAGGYVRNTSGQEGRVLVANGQRRVPMDAVAKSMKKIADQLKVAIDVEDAPSATPKDVNSILSKKDTKAVVFVVDDAGSDVPLLVAPDSRWASVNVRALGDGDVAGRVHKEVLRAFVYLCGGTASSYQNPMTYPITNVRQLDLISSPDLPIDVIMRFPDYLRTLGVTPYVQATYRTACRQGWAPQPTNDVQKAIWDEVHAMPTEPIKIKPETKKQDK